MAQRVAQGPSYQTRALSRALAILDLFSEECRTLAVKDIHARLGIPKPTIVRLASLLESEGYLRRHDAGYSIGPKALHLGSLYARDNALIDLSREPLEQLAARTFQTASLAKLAGSRIVHVVVAGSSRPVRHVKQAGTLGLPHATGVGKAILSRLPLEAVDRIMGEEPYQVLTPKTITRRKALLAELERVREAGYAVDDEETAPGLKCCAVPVAVTEADATAISLSGPAGEFDDAAIRDYVAALERTADAIRSSFA